MTQEEILEKLTMDIRLRGLSEDTVKEYCTRSGVFMRHFGKPADEMGEKEIRIFLEYLTNKGDLMPASINGYNSALRFLFEVTLEQNLNYKRLPRKKDPIKVPTAFTRDEIVAFLSVIDNIKYKAIFSLTYGSGLRLSEVRKLRIKDIDSENMRLFVYQGKGQRDRWVPMAKASLEVLRRYFKEYQPSHPDGWLFLNNNLRKKVADNYISERAVQDAFKKYHKKAKIKTYGTIHTLRHSYATHLMEDGVNVFFHSANFGPCYFVDNYALS
ncbi:tyrosine-type recombinase/integrase [Paludicola sp. MB14-C6]|uniref:tyrosine-type recombinase/integrase n=1 Tax=Paludihabitans sp. MB14-C6 TaxID=3070656 RepID=UPI0027DD935D|nr:tyrosine-type recombinase/integrase [Paludicola sp. MB14-C6]WMJ23183.1 tyrosine-type recombinase/integrase [Paludicola sp. MB14-C6]